MSPERCCVPLPTCVTGLATSSELSDFLSTAVCLLLLHFFSMSLQGFLPHGARCDDSVACCPAPLKAVGLSPAPAHFCLVIASGYSFSPLFSPISWAWKPYCSLCLLLGNLKSGCCLFVILSHMPLVLSYRKAGGDELINILCFPSLPARHSHLPHTSTLRRSRV